MEPRVLLGALRKGERPDPNDLRAFAAGLADGTVSDAQAGAFAMGVCLRGLGDEGRVALTESMRDSGKVLDWDLPGPVIDKHSTGGVGDCTSLILAPILAACGAYVPMISGRGLGHTGGTLDKLEAIPGVVTQVSERRFRSMVRDLGCAIVSASGDMAPADRRLYAVRDVSGTVESIDLITASILSKKLAAGLEGLVLDVKCGSGAFMKTEEDALALARALCDTANGAGCRTSALITDMSQPLAPALGNALEVAVCMEVLAGEPGADRMRDLTLDLCRAALEQADLDPARAEQVLASGQAMEIFARMIHALGGPPDMAQDWRTHLPVAPVVGDVPAPRDGVVTAIDGEALGLAVVALGGGRRVETDKIDPAVGLSGVIPLGATVRKGDPLATVHAGGEDSAQAAARAVRGAIVIEEGSVSPSPLILHKI
ncbi:MAG: thymidine phosphorylase [Rhodobacterales bacterium]|nr:MAG: thymidine phosphorylase [Rhodobacterales bacterium]